MGESYWPEGKANRRIVIVQMPERRETMAKKNEKLQKMTLQEKVDAIIKKAEEKGVSTDFFFVTTFKRYQVQMKIMNDLEKEINETGATVAKEYVKGRQNIYTNPAISEYNKTATAANGTVATLLKIITTLAEEEKKEPADLMSEFLNL